MTDPTPPAEPVEPAEPVAPAESAETAERAEPVAPEPTHQRGAHWSPDQPEPWTGAYAGTGTPGVGVPQTSGGAGAVGAGRPGAGRQPALGVSAALRAMSDLIRRAPRTVIAVAAVLSAIAALAQGILVALAPPAPLALPDPQVDPATALRELLLGTSFAQTAATIGVLVVSLIVQGVATGLYAVLLASAEPMSGRQAWRRVRPRLGALIVVSIGASVAAIGVLALGAVLASSLGTSPLAALLGLGILSAATAGGVWLSVSLVLGPAAVAVEWMEPMAAWRRSASLIRGVWWRTFLVWIVAQFLGAIGGLVLTIPASVITLFFGSSAVGVGAATAIQQFAAGLVLIPVVSIVVAVLHADRLRRSMSDPGATLGP